MEEYQQVSPAGPMQIFGTTRPHISRKAGENPGFTGIFCVFIKISNIFDSIDKRRRCV